jgi:uncharacterized protein YidB (DUF937 family)
MEYVNSPQVGGVPACSGCSRRKGLAGSSDSWISTGQNLPISADQLQSALHSDALTQAAQRFGVDPNQLTSMMSQLLPHILDKMTPNGQAAAGQ